MIDKFNVFPTPIEDLLAFERVPVTDNRGSFERIYCASTFESFGFPQPARQINRSVTGVRGTLRGLHYQVPPHAEDKIVSCIRGEVFDVAVDLRRDSLTFLKWHGEILSAKNCRGLIIPKGFAHGFQTLTDDCEILYVHSNDHAPEAEQGILYSDSRLAVGWPLPIQELSSRDSSWPELGDEFQGIYI